MGPGRRIEVEELLRNLHLTTEEMEITELSDDEDDDIGNSEMTVIGKVLSPVTIHASTILGAMKPAWGNPVGLKIRTVGEKGDNVFVVEFGDGQAMERALVGSPWTVGKYAIILQPYNGGLKPSDIRFDKMEMWIRVLNLPLGWMNEKRGAKAMSLIGELVKLDVDKDGKASGAFLRATVSVELSKPLRRGILLKPERSSKSEWLDIQYKELPFYCFACGILGHTEIECENPVVRNAEGKLPYDVKLHVPNDCKQWLQGFVQAAATSFGSSSSASSRQSKECGNQKGGKGDRCSDDGKDGEEVNSPVKPTGGVQKREERISSCSARRSHRLRNQPGIGNQRALAQPIQLSLT
ncbi:hypothetical protein QOZ80_7AG0567120 [Eleusine coracana subsp. coracana]|nr:hypothetical protein QOZ80_7AG0567120 [Eleusine coracana subsp. coracana]